MQAKYLAKLQYAENEKDKKAKKNKKNASKKLEAREELLGSDHNVTSESAKKQAAIFMSPIDGSSIIVSGNIN